jgi:hypothetical protein
MSSRRTRTPKFIKIGQGVAFSKIGEVVALQIFHFSFWFVLGIMRSQCQMLNTYILDANQRRLAQGCAV